MTVTVKVLSPHVLGKQQVVDFAIAVMRGGEVESSNLGNRIRQAAWLAVAYLDGQPVGVGALKYPTANHRESIYEDTGVELSELEYPYELGWIVIDPKARGQKLSRLIVEALLEKAQGRGVFCTVRGDNQAIQAACKGYGFEDAGVRWAGRQGALGLGLRKPA